MLTNVLQFGIKEAEFWDMNYAELERAVESRKQVLKFEAQQRANDNYILANLIVKGVSICLGDKDSFPTIETVYPTLFDDLKQEQENKIQERKNELSALRFKQFAHSFNENFKKNKEVPEDINE